MEHLRLLGALRIRLGCEDICDFNRHKEKSVVTVVRPLTAHGWAA